MEKKLDVIDIIKILGMIVVIGAIVIFVADRTVTATNLQLANASATGTYTFTDNTTTGEYVNITNATGSTMCFFINTTGIGKPTGCLVIRVDGTTNNNSAIGSARSLLAIMNLDADLNTTMVASNTTLTNVVITWSAALCTAGNSIVTTDTVTNGSWAAGTLSGGACKSSLSDMQTNILGAGQTGAGFVVVLIIALIGAAAIGYMSYLTGRKRE